MRKWLAPMLYHVQQNEPEAEPPVNIEPFVLTSPAKGDAYDFSVTLLRTATSAGKRARALLNDEVPEAEAVLQRACQEVRPITRRFEITEAGAAEQAANEKLRSISGSMTGVYRWTVRAEVNVPEEIRQLNRDAHRKQHDIRSDAAAALLQIKSTDEVRQKWQEFLAAVEGSARVVHAIQLAVAPEQLPQIIAELVEQRQQGAQELLGTVDRIMQSYQAVDMLNFVVSNESVLRSTLELLGLPVPPLEDDSLLVGGV
ncbi:hypothetical protein [Nonomuraea basaltis]|uniref:hypothetical protein n=1 Tax=Nonomuraea basaltis TaxID=2495887 RepID=UPI00110C599E|nr:hypothetical protein [Nonomuraea basaltis]TMR99601.1 hypothetical protein EJK15_07240 [Nonomuraea basaltis]